MAKGKSRHRLAWRSVWQTISLRETPVRKDERRASATGECGPDKEAKADSRAVLHTEETGVTGSYYNLLLNLRLNPFN
jgi:hypothetical protein